MKTNIKLKKANKLRLAQDKLRNNALKKGVELIAPETIFLSTIFLQSFLGPRKKNLFLFPSLLFELSVKPYLFSMFFKLSNELSLIALSISSFLNLFLSNLPIKFEIFENSSVGFKIKFSYFTSR